MAAGRCGFVDSRLRRSPPLRYAQSCGRPVENALRFPPPAHRPAAAHKLHSARSHQDKIRESQNRHSTIGLCLFHPGGCPNDRNHRSTHQRLFLFSRRFCPSGRMRQGIDGRQGQSRRASVMAAPDAIRPERICRNAAALPLLVRSHRHYAVRRTDSIRATFRWGSSRIACLCAAMAPSMIVIGLPRRLGSTPSIGMCASVVSSMAPA